MDPIELFNHAVTRVPAYRAFLEKATGSLPEVTSLEDFHRLPLMNKADYLLPNPVADLCLDGDPSCAHLWLRSSGTSRKPFFWPRRYEDEMNFPQGMKRLFHEYVSPENQPTLIIVGLALGPWGTGMQSSFAFRTLAQQSRGLAVVSPGLQNDNIIEVLERLSPHYRRTLLLSYPPFARNALEEAARRGLDLPSLNIHVMVGGEGITETFRERMWHLLGHDENRLNSVWCLYGSTDFANVGFENPLTIAIRRHLVRHDLCEQILGEADTPMLFQQVPGLSYFEVIDGELVVSRLQGIPLIRYRSGDHVRIIQRAELLARLKQTGFDAEEAVRATGLPLPPGETPFVALYGRIDHAIFFYGAKITVEQIKTALEAPAMVPYFNGRFLVRGIEDEQGHPQVEVALETCPALEGADLEAVAEQLAGALEAVQSEFREIRKLSPGQRHLRVVGAGPETFELGWKTRHM